MSRLPPDAGPLIAALDTDNLERAHHWATELAPHCALLKLGLAFFCAHGPAGLACIPGKLFLDLKLHDIPNTVAAAVTALAPAPPALLTLHAAGGTAMIQAARNAAERAAPPRIRLLAVTVLTSLTERDLAAIGTPKTLADQVRRLAALALSAGADGLVCSGHEVAMLRAECGPAPILVVPGIRPANTATNDQARTTTPHEALAAGADYLVIGRPLTEAKNPAAAAAALRAELAQ